MNKLAAILAAVTVTGGVAFCADWPQFLGPTRDGVCAEIGLLHAFPAEGPKVLWTARLGEGFGGAAIQGGKVYVLDRLADTQDVLRCWDLLTGKEEWHFSYDSPGKVSFNGSRSVPAVDDKYVFTVGVHGEFYCISKETHQPVWNKNLLKDFGVKLPTWAVSQSPLLYKDMVIVAPQSDNVGVVAYEKAAGKEIWKSKGVGALQYSSVMPARLAGEEQLLIMNGKCVAGLNPANGEILWTYTGLPVNVAAVAAPTVVSGDRVFVSGGYNAGCAMFKVEKTDGKFTVKELFKNKNVDAHVHNAILHKDYLYVLCNTNNRKDGLVCLDLEGNVKWKTGDKMFDKGGSILADGMLYIVEGATGELKIVDPQPEALKVLSSAKVLGGKNVWAPLAISDGKLVCRDQKQMMCLDIKAK